MLLQFDCFYPILLVYNVLKVSRKCVQIKSREKPRLRIATTSLRIDQTRFFEKYPCFFFPIKNLIFTFPYIKYYTLLIINIIFVGDRETGYTYYMLRREGKFQEVTVVSRSVIIIGICFILYMDCLRVVNWSLIRIDV